MTTPSPTPDAAKLVEEAREMQDDNSVPIHARMLVVSLADALQAAQASGAMAWRGLKNIADMLGDPVSEHIALGVASGRVSELLDALQAACAERDAANQRMEWIASALAGDVVFGTACGDPLFQQVVQLRHDLATLRADRAREGA